MRTLYVKYSSERLPQYQIKTTIFQKCYKRYVSKKCLTESGQEHIQAIYKNYEILKKHTKGVAISKPVKISKDEVIFEYIEGFTFESSIYNIIKSGDKNRFIKEISIYYNMLKNMGSIEHVSIENKEFENFFGIYNELLGIECLKNIDIDMNFNNFIIDNKGKVTVIDYEWVFDFPVPIEYILYRSLKLVYEKYISFISRWFSSEELFNIFNIKKDRISIYDKMEQRFRDSIYGETQEYKYLSNYIQQQYIIDKIEFKDRIDSKVEVYIDTGNGFNTGEYKEFSFTGRTAKLSVDLSNYTNITAIRVDPTEYSCILKIKSIIMIVNDNQKQYISPSISTAFYKTDNIYYFFEDNPHLYFSLETDIKPKKLDISFEVLDFNIKQKEYLKHLFETIKSSFNICPYEQRATIFLDLGEGFSDENCITILNYLDDNGYFNIQFNLNSILDKEDQVQIKAIRFDPIENMICTCKINEIVSNGNTLEIKPLNPYMTTNGWSEFLTLDPIYLLDGEYENTSCISISGNIKQLDIEYILEKLNLFVR